MPINLYCTPSSPPCAAVLLTAKAIGLELNVKSIDLMKGEHLTLEFLKLNPMHTVPTIDDNGFVLFESRAIITYLVDQYAKNDSLYPKDPKQRSVIEQRLYFDLASFYMHLANYYYPVLFGTAPEFNEELRPKIDEGFQFLNTFLEGKEYAAGDRYTLADVALVTSVAAYEALAYDFSKHANVCKWYAKIKGETVGWKEILEKEMSLLKGYYNEFRRKQNK